MQTTFEKLGGTYRQVGDYLLPNIEVPESPQIGIWGQRRLVLSSFEYRQMLYGLIHFSNKLIQQGRYPDAIDELLIKLQKARRYRHG